MKVLKVPYNAGNLKDKDGLELAPDAVEAACKDFYMSEEGVLPILDFEAVEVDNSNIDDSQERIEEGVVEIDHFATVVGGDHSITLPAFKGFARGKTNPGLIVFDAHPDLMHSFGTHEDYLRTLIDEGVVKAQNVILVGLRNSDKEELKYLKEKKIKYYSMKELEIEGRDSVCDSIMAVARQWSDLYVSLDIDVLDPAFAPGTGYCEPGGLTTRELLYFVHRIKNLKNFGMADIVEVNPKLDRDDLTVRAAAKLLVELS